MYGATNGSVEPQNTHAIVLDSEKGLLVRNEENSSRRLPYEKAGTALVLLSLVFAYVNVVHPESQHVPDVSTKQHALGIVSLMSAAGTGVELDGDYDIWFTAGSWKRSYVYHAESSRVNDVEVLFGSGGYTNGVAVYPDAGQMYMTNPGKNGDKGMISMSNVDGSEAATVMNLESSSPSGICLDIDSELVYWTESDKGAVIRSDLEGSKLEAVIWDIPNPVDVKLHTITQRLFVASFDGSIYTATTSGTEHKLLLNASCTIGGLDIIPPTNQLFYACGGDIWSVDSETGGSRTLVVGGFDSISSIAITPNFGTLWVVDQGSEVISACAINGSECWEVFNVEEPKYIHISTFAESSIGDDANLGDNATALPPDDDQVMSVLPEAEDPTEDEDTAEEESEDSSTTTVDEPWTYDLFVSSSTSGTSGPYIYELKKIEKKNTTTELVAHFADGLALDQRSGFLFFTDRTNSIMRTSLAGKHEHQSYDTLYTYEGSPRGIALAPSEGYLYWVDDSNAAVMRGSTDGLSFETVFTGILEMRDVKLTYDASTGECANMFISSAFDNTIVRTDCDGGDVTDLLTGFNEVVGMALDPLHDVIFWADSTEIHMANLTTGEYINQIADGFTSLSYLDIDVSKGRLYFTDSGDDAVWGMDLSAGELRKLATVKDACGVVALHNMSQTYTSVPVMEPTATPTASPTASPQKSPSAAPNPSPTSGPTQPMATFFFTAGTIEDTSELWHYHPVSSLSSAEYLFGESNRTGDVYAVAYADQLNAVFFSTGSQGIYTSNLDKPTPKLLFQEGTVSEIRGLDVDPYEGLVYWVDHQLGCIMRGTVDGESVELLASGLTQAHDIKLRFSGSVCQTIYVSTSDGIYSGTCDGKSFDLLVSASGAKGLALDAKKGQLYFNDGSSSVYRVDWTSGKSLQTLYNPYQGTFSSFLDVDPLHRVLYVTDDTWNTIWSLKIDLTSEALTWTALLSSQSPRSVALVQDRWSF